MVVSCDRCENPSVSFYIPDRSFIIIHQVCITVLVCLLPILPTVPDIYDWHNPSIFQHLNNLAAVIPFVTQKIFAAFQPLITDLLQLFQQFLGLCFFAV